VLNYTTAASVIKATYIPCFIQYPLPRILGDMKNETWWRNGTVQDPRLDAEEPKIKAKGHEK